MNQHIEPAICWLAESNIRNSEKAEKTFGGLNAGYDWRKKIYPSVYSEITGYGISVFLNIFKWTRTEEYLCRAMEAADYLCGIRCLDKDDDASGAIPHSISIPDLRIVRTYWSFDNAMILCGLAKLYSISRDKRLLTVCLGIASWLLKIMQNRDGSFLAFYDAEAKSRQHGLATFHGDRGCLHIKNVFGLLLLAEIAHDEKYNLAAGKVCHWGLSLQAPDGLFWANHQMKYVFTHAHCYATEGYLCAYHYLKESRWLETAELAANALITVQNRDGSLYSIYKNRLSFKGRLKTLIFPNKTTDATAQAIRIWLILYHLTHNKRYLLAAESGLTFLKGMQDLKSTDRNRLGGFYYQCSDRFFKRKLSDMMYAWCTQFSLSALYAYLHSDRTNAYAEIMDELF